MDPIHSFVAHDSYVIKLAFDPNGQTLFSAGMDNVVHQWETDGWHKTATFSGHEKSVNSFALSPDARTMVTGSSDTTVRIWDVATQRTLRTLQDRKRVVAAVALSRDGQWVAAGSYKGRVAVWTMGGESVAGFAASDGNLTTVAFQPGDDRILASAGLGPEIKLWSLPKGEMEAKLEAETAAVVAVRFTPDGRHLVALTYEGHAHVWDSGTWTDLPDLGADLGGARTLVMNAEGNRCVVLRTGQAEVRSFPGWDTEMMLDVDANVLNAAAFSPSAEMIAIGGADGKIRIYEMEP